MGPELRRLVEPVPRRMVRTVPAGGGKDADYLPHYHVRQLLLYHLGRPYQWSVKAQGFHPQIGTRKRGDRELPVFDCGQEEPAWLVGELTVTIDGEQVTVDGTGVGSDIKSAESDALKRAASNLGVGLDLWAEGGKDYWLAAQLAKDEAE